MQGDILSLPHGVRDRALGWGVSGSLRVRLGGGQGVLEEDVILQSIVGSLLSALVILNCV